jgi:xanthine/uracil permease
MAHRTKRGLRFTGLMNIFSGGVGVIGPLTFHLVPSNYEHGCASRYTLLPAGAALIFCAFFPDVIVFLSSIPKP